MSLSSKAYIYFYYFFLKLKYNYIISFSFFPPSNPLMPYFTLSLIHGSFLFYCDTQADTHTYMYV